MKRAGRIKIADAVRREVEYETGVPYYVSGVRMTPVDTGFYPVDDHDGPAAAAMVNSWMLEGQGVVQFIFDCGIEGAAGSWPFAINLHRLSDELFAHYGFDEESVEMGELFARALELEAARVRAKARRIKDEL